MRIDREKPTAVEPHAQSKSHCTINLDPSPNQPSPAVSITVASAVAHTDHTTIIWSVEHASTAPYAIERRHGIAAWKRLTLLSVERGQLVLEDRAVLRGELYGYRVRLGRDATSSAAGEVTVEMSD